MTPSALRLDALHSDVLHDNRRCGRVCRVEEGLSVEDFYNDLAGDYHLLFQDWWEAGPRDGLRAGEEPHLARAGPAAVPRKTGKRRVTKESSRDGIPCSLAHLSVFSQVPKVAVSDS
jgi:hypothetical protein